MPEIYWDSDTIMIYDVIKLGGNLSLNFGFWPEEVQYYGSSSLLSSKLSQNHGNEMHGLESLRKGGKRTQVPQPGGIFSQLDRLHPLKRTIIVSHTI